MSFGEFNNCYDTAPTGYNNDSPHSEDSTDTINPPPSNIGFKTPPHINNLFGPDHSPLSQLAVDPTNFPFPNSSPQPPLNLDISINNTIGNTVNAISDTFSAIMPAFGTKSNGHKTAFDKLKVANTQKLKLKLVDIFEGPTSIAEKTILCENVFCGNYVFDIGFYIKESAQSQDDNYFVVTIEHKKFNRDRVRARNRGQKRKRDDQNEDGTVPKKRRLNGNQSQSQSYSNGHGVSERYQKDPPVSDRITVNFTINYSGPSNNNNNNNSSQTLTKKTSFVKISMMYFLCRFPVFVSFQISLHLMRILVILCFFFFFYVLYYFL